MDKCLHINKLPRELLFTIFDTAVDGTHKNVALLSLVCKHWWQLLNCDHFWVDLCDFKPWKRGHSKGVSASLRCRRSHWRELEWLLLRVRPNNHQSLERTFRVRNRQPSKWLCWRNVVKPGVTFNALCHHIAKSHQGNWYVHPVAWHNNRKDGLLPYLCEQEALNAALHWPTLTTREKGQRLVKWSRERLMGNL